MQIREGPFRPKADNIVLEGRVVTNGIKERFNSPLWVWTELGTALVLREVDCNTPVMWALWEERKSRQGCDFNSHIASEGELVVGYKMELLSF